MSAQSSAKGKPLAGLRVGISISESDELEARGFTASAMNRLTVRWSEALLAAGATVVFGHDWREDGVMDAVCRSALGAAGYPEPGAPPPILNLLSWPDETRIDSEVLQRLHGVVRVRSVGLPDDLMRYLPLRKADPEFSRYLRSRGLTYLRRRLTRECQARICLGGRESGYQGRYPGILEEALLAFKECQPVYLVGFLGGVADRLGRMTLDLEDPGRGKELSLSSLEGSEFSLKDLYRGYSASRKHSSSFDPADDESFDLDGAWRAARDLGRERLEANRLDNEENLRLIETRSEEEAIILVLRGLRRLLDRKQEQGAS